MALTLIMYLKIGEKFCCRLSLLILFDLLLLFVEYTLRFFVTWLYDKFKKKVRKGRGVIESYDSTHDSRLCITETNRVFFHTCSKSNASSFSAVMVHTFKHVTNAKSNDQKSRCHSIQSNKSYSALLIFFFFKIYL